MEISGLSETYPSSTTEREDVGKEQRESERGGRGERRTEDRKVRRKGIENVESEKTRPPPKSPLPIPRQRIKSNKDEEKVPLAPAKSPSISPICSFPVVSPSRPLPIPKSRLGNRERDRGPIRQDEDEELNVFSPNATSPMRPVPRARIISKGDTEQVQRSTRGDEEPEIRGGEARGKDRGGARGRGGGGGGGWLAGERGEKEEVVVSSKQPVPRKRASKDSLALTSPTNIQPKFSSQNLPTSIMAPDLDPLRFSLTPLSPGSTPGVRTSLTKRKKGGGIRVPLWNAPPPPAFSPPSTPTRRDLPRKLVCIYAMYDVLLILQIWPIYKIVLSNL